MTSTSAPGVRETIRELPTAGRLLIVGIAVNRAGSFVQVFLVLFLLDRGESATYAGAALTAYAAGAVAGLLVGGIATDRIGSRSTIVASNALGGFLVGAIPFVSGRLSLLAVCAATGLVTQLYRPAAMTLLAALTPPERMVLVSAAYRFGLNVGATAGPLLGAALVAWSFHALFLADMVTTLAFALVARAGLPATVKPAPTANPDPGAPRRSPLRDRRFLAVVVGVTLIAVVEVQYTVALPLETRADGVPAWTYGVLVALNGLVIISLELPVTRVVQRWPLRRTVPAGIALIGLGIAGYGLPGGLPLLFAATALWTIGEMVAAPAVAAYPALISDPATRGRHVAAVTGGQGAGYALGPLIGAAAYSWSAPVTWVACALLGAVAAALARFGVREVDRTP